MLSVADSERHVNARAPGFFAVHGDGDEHEATPQLRADLGGVNLEFAVAEGPNDSLATIGVGSRLNKWLKFLSL